MVCEFCIGTSTPESSTAVLKSNVEINENAPALAVSGELKRMPITTSPTTAVKRANGRMKCWLHFFNLVEPAAFRIELIGKKD